MRHHRAYDFNQNSIGCVEKNIHNFVFLVLNKQKYLMCYFKKLMFGTRQERNILIYQ